MCTLTFMPYDNGHVCITSNRDEGIQRQAATLPQLQKLTDGSHVLMPIDPEAHGTWLATHLQQQRTHVLLNGAFSPHPYRPPYRRSRGLVLLDAFAYDDLQHFAATYSAQGIEPFTLVAFRQGNPVIEEVRWDGLEFHVRQLVAGVPHIWSAAMLYPASVQRSSEERFTALGKQVPEETLLRFHQAEEYAPKMNREGYVPTAAVQTLSTSQLIVDEKGFSHHYLDHRHRLTVQIQSAWKA